VGATSRDRDRALMLGSGLSYRQRSDFQQTNFSTAADRAESATHTSVIRKTGIEKRHAIYASVATAEIARFRIDAVKGEWFERGRHAQPAYFAG
jgi:hypothetical protein